MYAEKWKCDRTAIFYSRKHDISWIMLKVRECLWAGRFFSLSSSDTACTGASVLWWRDNGNKLFLFQLFFNLFLSSWTDVFNFFFHLPFDHFSFGVIIPSSISLLSLMFVSISNNFSWRVSYMHDAPPPSLSLPITSSNARDEKRMAAKRKTDRKLKDKAFENYSSVEKRMWCEIVIEKEKQRMEPEYLNILNFCIRIEREKRTISW